MSEVENLIEGIDKRRFAEGKFQGKEISVGLRENKYAMLFGWVVRISVFSQVDGHSNFNSKERSFRKRRTAAEYFEGLIKKYNLEEIGGGSC